jgi:glycine cleavage system H lipoate-binding protein
MFPWNYGFHWSTGTIIFMGAFYAVLVVVATTVLRAVLRSRRALDSNRAHHIAWHSDFHDLSTECRSCRHVLTGKFSSRECPNAFDCRECATHAKLIALRPMAQSAGIAEDISGMAFPLDRFYHRGHTWARLESDGNVTVGLDELGKRLIGLPDAVKLPQPGEHVHANGVAFHLFRRGAHVTVLSPVDGEVVENGSGSDWYLKVKPESTGELTFRHLLRGDEIKPWLMREMERLQLALSPEEAGATLADGGVPVEDIAAAYPNADWDAVCGNMFLRP